MKRKDYENKADEAVQSFLTSGDSLQESIVKIAQRDSLNPEQIKRVVEMANTGAFLELFKKTAGQEDRMVDFEVADPGNTVDAFYDAHPEAEAKVASFTPSEAHASYYANVVDENINYPVEELEKVASETETVVEKEASFEEKQINEIRAWKIADNLRDKIAAADYASRDIADRLARSFAGIYTRDQYPEFEKNAFALYGSEAAFVAQAVRNRLDLPALRGIPSPGLIKQASEFQVVDASDSLLKEAGEYIGKVKEYVEYSKALDIINSRKAVLR